MWGIGKNDTSEQERELTVSAILIVRNNSGIQELEESHDDDDEFVPAFVDVDSDDGYSGMIVIKCHDLVRGWRFLVQPE